MADVKLDIQDLRIDYAQRGRFSRRKNDAPPAVDGVSLSVRANEILALIGESGSGKSSVALAAAGMTSYESGRITYAGEQKRHAVQMILQDSSAALDPRWKVRRSIAEPIWTHWKKPDDLDKRVEDAARLAQFPRELLDRLPHELSGGQRQRVCIARAIMTNPDVLICDEPTSALDVSVQADILQTFRHLRDELGIAILFISHDLAVVRHLANRVAVMHNGKLVEEGSVEQIMQSPQHPYTRALLEAHPDPHSAIQARNHTA